MNPGRARTGTVAAALASLLSFAFAAFTLAGIRRDLAGLRERERTAATLAALEADAAELRRWRGVCEQRADAAGPADLSALAAAYLPPDSARLRSRPDKPLSDPGWAWAEVEVSFTALEFERLAKFIARAESEPLPWAVSQLTAEAVTPSAATGTLTLRRLQAFGAEPNE